MNIVKRVADYQRVRMATMEGHGKNHWAMHDRSGSQGSTVVTSVGEFSNIILCFPGKNT